MLGTTKNSIVISPLLASTRESFNLAELHAKIIGWGLPNELTTDWH